MSKPPAFTGEQRLRIGGARLKEWFEAKVYRHERGETPILLPGDLNWLQAQWRATPWERRLSQDRQQRFRAQLASLVAVWLLADDHAKGGAAFSTFLAMRLAGDPAALSDPPSGYLDDTYALFQAGLSRGVADRLHAEPEAEQHGPG